MDKMIFSITPAEALENPVFDGLYKLAANKLGYREKEETRYDCTKICVAKNLQDICFEHFKSKGADDASIGMQWCFAGPKTDDTLNPNQISVEPGFIKEEVNGQEVVIRFWEKPFNLEDAVNDLLNSDENLDSLAETILNEADTDDEPFYKKCRAFLQAYKNNSVDEFCIALTGWSFESLLKKSGLIPDYDGTFSG